MPLHSDYSSEACNIGPQGQARRRAHGMFFLVVAGVIGGWVIAFDSPLLHKLVVFPFFLAGFISLLEARRKVCVIRAAGKTAERE